jgi:demethylmenaquinone methyltransferase/2-methoxy-6-polyprenyl-1,4-benzoquinol methylase
MAGYRPIAVEVNKPTVVGAAPQGATDARSAARAVREMFTSIAPRYDLLNHLLSFNVDRMWWRRAARTFRDILIRPDARVLDLCCGTGDMTFALHRLSERGSAKHGFAEQLSAEQQRAPQNAAGKSSSQILGADFSHAMLQRAAAKSSSAARNASTPRWIEADALNLPFPSEHFHLVTSAFGFRNLADYDAGLREIVRVLRPGGECGILDFGEPKGPMGALYRLYFKRILPRAGTLISGVRGPYAYLPASVERFPEPEEMLARMKNAGFSEAAWTPYTFGIAGLYRGKRSSSDGRPHLQPASLSSLLSA